jgi:predicted methyltransferase
MYVLSRLHVQPLLAARRDGKSDAITSLDLGLSREGAGLTPEGITLPDGQSLPWSTVEAIASDEAACVVVEHNTARKIHAFSPDLGRAYSLLATGRAPTLINGGFTMHRIVGIDPHEDTLRKIRAIAPVRGDVLDTVTGLGYTAIEAATTAQHVVTVEIDPTVLEIARLNPWSRALFERPNIERIVGDTYEEIQKFDDRRFTRVIHDPPSLSLAGELYSGEYYRRVFRVLRDGGRLFHYVGNLESKHGSRVVSGVMRRLHDAGFTRVIRRPEAFGLVAYKS